MKIASPPTSGGERLPINRRCGDKRDVGHSKRGAQNMRNSQRSRNCIQPSCHDGLLCDLSGSIRTLCLLT